MAKSRLFGGVNLADVAQSVKDRDLPSPFEQGTTLARPVVPAAELALTGRVAPPLERENIFSVDPKRCRPWKFHDRTASWYTRERCADLIESIPKDGQQAPAVARKLVGDPEFDYELVSGMRRRYACEYLNAKLKVRLVQVDDAQAAVLMHIENADRQDILPMERALSFSRHLEAGLFGSQDALAEAMNLSKGHVTKLIKAAGLLKVGALSGLFPDPGAVPVALAYDLAALLDRPGAREVVFERARALLKKGEAGSPVAVLKSLLASLDSSKRHEAVKKTYNLGAAGKLVAARNAKGKVTLSIPGGLKGVSKADVLAAMEKVLADLG